MGSSPGILGRTTEVEFQRAVGRQRVPLGTFTTRLGPRGLSVPGGADLGPRGPGLEAGVVDLGPEPFEPDRLAEGTVATVQMIWHDDVLDLAADAVTDAHERLTLLWMGFRIPGGEHPMDPSWELGYSASGQIPTFVQEQRRGRFGGGGDFRSWDADTWGAQHALDELRRATANLAAIGWPDQRTAPHGALTDLTATARQLATDEIHLLELELDR